MDNASAKKSSIPSLEEYDRLSALYHDAYDRLQAGEMGTGYGGIHFEFMHELSRYRIAANGREDAVRLLRRLLREYEKTELGSGQATSDEEYLSRFDEIQFR